MRHLHHCLATYLQASASYVAVPRRLYNLADTRAGARGALIHHCIERQKAQFFGMVRRGEHVLERTRVVLFRDGSRMGVCSSYPRDGWPPRHLRKAAYLYKTRAAVAGEARVRPLRSLRRQRGFGGVERLLRLIRALRAGGRRARLDRLLEETARSGRRRLGPSVCGAACPFVDTCLRVCGAPQLPRDSAGLVADTARAHQSVFLCYAKNPTVVSLSSGLYTCSACGTARGYGGKPYTC